MKNIYYLLLILTISCQSESKDSTQWFKGNTHAHTVICGHADSTPEEVVEWYHNQGYNFLILSEHNHFINPDSVIMPAELRSDFILIPGEEVTGHLGIHTTAFDINHFVHPGHDRDHKHEVMQDHVDSTHDAGGIPILNHPNFVSGAQVSDIAKVKGLQFFELYNGHPSVRNFGTQDSLNTFTARSFGPGQPGFHIPLEEKWDSLLSQGIKVFGIASDDAHHFQDYSLSKSNPGRGWTMVKAKTLNPKSIRAALLDGHFYASSGVAIKDISYKNENYIVTIDSMQTAQDLTSEFLVGKRIAECDQGIIIEFIGEFGKVLQRSTGYQSTYKANGNEKYIRSRVTMTYIKDDLCQSFFAWTQPVFL